MGRARIFMAIAGCLMVSPLPAVDLGQVDTGRIEAATIASYEKLGAEYGGWVKAGKGRAFQAGRDKAEKGVPGFRFHVFPKGKLPAVEVPFGLDLSFSNVNAAGLKRLVSLKNMIVLDLRYTKTTDAELRELAGLSRLASLNLCHTQVTDAGLKELACHTNLARLNLTGAHVTDAGLRYLTDLKNLASLYLEGTQVTNAGISALRKALPKCVISFQTGVGAPVSQGSEVRSSMKGK
jgi:Leucine Rich repeat